MLPEAQQAKGTNGWESERRRNTEIRRERDAKVTQVEILVALCVWGCSASTLWQAGGDLSPLSGTLRPDRAAMWESPPARTRKHRCVDCVCVLWQAWWSRFFCLALTSMSLAETRRDSSAFKYSWTPHFCRFPLSILTFSKLVSCLRPLPTIHSRAVSITFSGLYISDCVIYSLFFSFLLSQCVLEFVTECYLLCLTTWCKVLDSLYFGCAEWAFGSGEIQHGDRPRT